MNRKIFYSNLAVILVAVILFVVVWAGVRAGKKTAEARVVLGNAQAISEAANFFYSDQDRYPTAAEVASLSLMLKYTSKFPPLEFTSDQCPQSYSYKRLSRSSYQLEFCLPRAFNGFKAGWNQVTESK